MRKKLDMMRFLYRVRNLEYRQLPSIVRQLGYKVELAANTNPRMFMKYEYTNTSLRKFSVFNEFSKQLKGEATSNPEFQKSMKELNEKIGVVAEDLKVRTKKTTEKFYKSVDAVWTEAGAASKKVSTNVKEKISAAKDEVKETFGVGKQDSSVPTSASAGPSGSKNESATCGMGNSDVNSHNAPPGQTETVFGRIKSTISSTSPSLFEALGKLKNTRISDVAKKGYDIVKDELSSNPTKKKFMKYGSESDSAPPIIRSTKTDIVFVPSKLSFVGETWEAIKSHPIINRMRGFSQPVNEIAEDIRERWETSDHPVVEKIQNINATVFGETSTATSVKEIRFRDPSFSLPDFVDEVQERIRPVLTAYFKGDVETLRMFCCPEILERCKAEREAYESHGIFFENKILHISEVFVKETKMTGSTPMIVVGFQSQQIYCVRDKEGSVIAGGKDTIQNVYTEWAMQQMDIDELGEEVICEPLWRLRDMQQNVVQALI